MTTITVTMLVPESIRRLMAETPHHPPTMTERDVQQYVAGVVIAALTVMGPTGAAVGREMRVLNEDRAEPKRPT